MLPCCWAARWKACLLSGGMVAKDYARLEQAAKLPPGIRRAGMGATADRLISQRMIDEAPSVAGPVCIFYDGRWRDYEHFLTGAMLSLHVLAPHLPPATRLVLPAAPAGAPRFDAEGFLAALGFGQFATLEIDAPAVLLADAIWLSEPTIAAMPAAHVQSFRARGAAMRPAPTGEKAAVLYQTGNRAAGGRAGYHRRCRLPAGF